MIHRQEHYHVQALYPQTVGTSDICAPVVRSVMEGVVVLSTLKYFWIL